MTPNPTQQDSVLVPRELLEKLLQDHLFRPVTCALAADGSDNDCPDVLPRTEWCSVCLVRALLKNDPTPARGEEGAKSTVVPCPRCGVGVFLYPSGNTVPHYNARGEKCLTPAPTPSAPTEEPTTTEGDALLGQRTETSANTAPQGVSETAAPTEAAPMQIEELREELEELRERVAELEREARRGRAMR